MSGKPGICAATVYALCARGALPHVRVLNAIRVAPGDQEAFVEGRRGHPRTPVETARTRLTGPARQQADRIDRWWRRTGWPHGTSSLVSFRRHGRYWRKRRTSAAHSPSGKALASAGRRCLGLIITPAPGTAWCEGVPGDGEGQWLEVRAEAPARPGWECAFLDGTVVPGLAATPKTCAANGRPRRVKLGPCAGGPGVEAKITEARGDRVSDERVHIAWRGDRMSALGPELERAPIWIQLPPRALGGERACLRLTILDVLPGEKFHDTCVSEFTPRLYCHPRP